MNTTNGSNLGENNGSQYNSQGGYINFEEFLMPNDKLIGPHRIEVRGDLPYISTPKCR